MIDKLFNSKDHNIFNTAEESICSLVKELKEIWFLPLELKEVPEMTCKFDNENRFV